MFSILRPQASLSDSQTNNTGYLYCQKALAYCSLKIHSYGPLSNVMAFETTVMKNFGPYEAQLNATTNKRM
uniref:Uncharacterized protein n=1 Tax=Arundo donax TaxID=35708 RepID=A0A0A9CB64_ARUDO